MFGMGRLGGGSIIESQLPNVDFPFPVTHNWISVIVVRSLILDFRSSKTSDKEHQGIYLLPPP